jgi:hypothetical protein
LGLLAGFDRHDFLRGCELEEGGSLRLLWSK